MIIDHESLGTTFSGWLVGEHARLHGPGTSVMSDLNTMRRATSLGYDNPSNIPVKKTQAHLRRMRHHLDALLEVGYDQEQAGRLTSDILKLLAGQQVKRLVANSSDQTDFVERLRYADHGVRYTLLMSDLQSTDTQEITQKAELLDFKLNGAIRQIADRAQDGSDWGKEDSEMVKAAWLGEAACAQFAVSAIDFLAGLTGSIEQVPLRTPAKDEADAPFEFPFRTAQL